MARGSVVKGLSSGVSIVIAFNLHNYHSHCMLLHITTEYRVPYLTDEDVSQSKYHILLNV